MKILLAVGVAVALVTATTPAQARHHHRPWQAAWATAVHHPFPGWETPNWSAEGFAGQTLRQVVRVSTGGSTARIRLTNAYGTQPLRVAGATIGKAASGAAVKPGTLRRLTFGRAASVTVPAGQGVASDAVALPTRALESLTITLYFATPTGPATFHEGALATSYRAGGDRRFDTGAGAFGETSSSWYFLAGVDTAGGPRPARGVVVALGDSITDGYGTTPGANNRYPDELAERLGRGVVNSGINGNKVLADSPCFGASTVSRFDRDVLGQPGARTVVVLAGINDIGAGGYPDFGCGASPVVTAEDVIAGYRRLIRAAHAAGLSIVGATITPMKGAEGYFDADKEKVRDAVNHWIRHSGEYDAVADLDRALAQPGDPDALLPAYDSGDHLHPNDAGAAAMATVVASAIARA